MPTLAGFNGASIVPDVMGALRQGGQNIMAARSVGREMEADQLAQQAATGNEQALIQLGRIDPNTYKQVADVIASKDAARAAAAQKQAEERGLMAMQFLEVPVDKRQQFLSNVAQTWSQEGRDLSELVKISGMNIDQQEQYAKSQLLAAVGAKKALEGAFGGAQETFGNRDYIPDPDRPGFMNPVVYTKSGVANIDRSVQIPEKVVYLNAGNQYLPMSPTGGAAPAAGGAIPIAPTPGEALRNDPATQAAVASAEAEAAAAGRERGESKGKKEASAGSADVAIAELNSLIDNLGKLPAAPVASDVTEKLAYFGIQDTAQQEALGNIDRIGGKMLAYVERLPGAATDRDREVFMASAGILNNPKAPRDRRIAAAKSAIESFQRLKDKYGQAKPAGQPSAGDAPAAAVDFLRKNNTAGNKAAFKAKYGYLPEGM